MTARVRRVVMAPKFVCPDGELAGMDYEHVAPRLTLPHVDWARAARAGGHPGATRRFDGLEKAQPQKHLWSDTQARSRPLASLRSLSNGAEADAHQAGKRY